jgi:hypothetical protein
MNHSTSICKVNVNNVKNVVSTWLYYVTARIAVATRIYVL